MSDTRVSARPYVIGPTQSFFLVPASSGASAVTFNSLLVNNNGNATVYIGSSTTNVLATLTVPSSANAMVIGQNINSGAGAATWMLGSTANSSNAFTLVGTIVDGALGVDCRLYILLNPATTASTLSVSWTGGDTRMVFSGSCFNNVSSYSWSSGTTDDSVTRSSLGFTAATALNHLVYAWGFNFPAHGTITGTSLTQIDTVNVAAGNENGGSAYTTPTSCSAAVGIFTSGNSIIAVNTVDLIPP